MAQVNRNQLDFSDTIFALSSGALPCAVAIIRVSGPAVFDLMSRCFRSYGASSNGPVRQRALRVGVWCDCEGKPIDEVVALTFVAPHSFSGEDLLEIQCHGSVAVVQRIESELVRCGIRPAHRGEFSYRAMHHGKLSPQQVDRLGDLFLAREPAELERLLARHDDSFSHEVSLVRGHLLRLQAVLDTAVDFSEEYASVVALAGEPLLAARAQCLSMAKRYERFRSGTLIPRMVLAGSPNAGKSSLFNALLGRYRAIVHCAQGTTRDAVEEDVEIGERRWRLADTAGIRNAESEVEKAGIELSEDYLRAASFWILVVDGVRGLSADDERLLERHGQRPHLIVWNKKDRPDWVKPPVERLRGETVEISASTGEGLQVLLDRLVEVAISDGETLGALPSSVQAQRLKDTVSDLDRLEEGLKAGEGPEVLGERCRSVVRRLESVIGSVSPDDILDRVFGEFCIGK